MSHEAGRFHPWLAAGLPGALAFLVAVPAWAQMGGMSPGMGPGMGRPGGTAAQPQDKDEGPAEVAPDADEKAPPSKESDTAYLELARRRTKVIEIDGYFRLRTDYLYKMNLGQGYNNGGPGPSALPPFPVPSECLPDGSVGQNGGNSQAGQPIIRCGDKSMGDGNIRLRLEPTVNISDQVRVRSQIDVFDNLILGTTPDSLVNPTIPDQNAKVGQTSSAAPADVLSNTQTTSASNIVAKRAWGEIDTLLGSLRFGRMPWHFGRGMYFNRGDCADCEGGTNVDRFMGLTTVYGHQLALSVDFGAQGYHLGYTDLGQKNTGGFPLDLTQKDDVTQLMGALTKIDEDRVWRERIAAGDVALNYGAQVVYRSQDYATYSVSSLAGSPYDTNPQNPLSSGDLGNSLVTNVNALLFIPSLWFKFGWKALTLEFEGTMLAGKLGNAGPLRLDTTDDKGLTILQAGWVLSSSLRLYDDALFVGFETGGATGDQAELAYDPARTNTATGLYYPYLNYRWKFVPQPAGDRNLNDFHFSPEYHVDEILYRRILGTISNAIYLKPSIAYWLDLDSKKEREIGFSGAVVYSLAPVPVATPGNSLNYGVEMDLALQYRNLRENVFAGFTWGVFWPMAALTRPRVDASAPLWSSPEDANAAQVVRLFAGIRF
ncbi:MAG: TIGR04551 family protein [Deltaproteobacteria bacterium]|nr:TIGR04551 family protein [Deltaproteobacteria bacterium]